MRLQQFCIPFETALLSHVQQYWRKLLGEEHDFFSRFLYPTDELATTYPRNHWRWYRIVIHKNGKIVGIDDDDYDNRIMLTKQDVIMHDFDMTQFRREICENFDLKACGEEIKRYERMIPLGIWEPEKGMRYPVTLYLIGIENKIRERIFERIIQRQAAGEIIITPTRRKWTTEIEELARKNKIQLVPLEEIVMSENGKLLPTPEWNEYLTAFCKMVEMDLPSSLRQKPKSNLFAKRGEWIIRFAEKEMTLNGNLQGPALIRHLMKTPNQEIHVEQLWNDVFCPNHKSAVSVEGEWSPLLFSGEDVLDNISKKNYQNRLLELLQERTKAESMQNQAWLDRINQETEMITSQLDKAVGHQGKNRKIGDNQDRLRKRISRNVTFFLDKIRTVHPEFVFHVKNL